MENSIMTSVALSLLLGIATTASAESTLLADNVSSEETSEHIHTWSKGRIIKEATCIGEGSVKYICLDNDCDASRTEVIAALGHDFNLEFITDLTPTCDQTGSKSKHCTRCAALDEITEIPAKGHTWSKGDTIQEASCNQEGIMSHHCENYNCQATKSSVIPAMGHEWDEGNITAQATCTQKGILKYNCIHKGCNTTKIEYTQALGHNFAEKFTVDLAATCTESGRKSQHCSRCEERINTTILPAIGHAWTPSSTIEPASCTQEGLSVMRCKHIGCGESITQTTAALGHNFTAEYVVDKAATCSHEGIQSRHCSRCDIHGEEIAIPTLTHIAGDTIVEHMITACCHNEGSYDKAVYCTACKGEMYRKSFIIPVKEHTWDEGQFTIYPTTSNKGKKVYTCVECKITRHEIIDKLYVAIQLAKNAKGESFKVSKEGFCPGSENQISYQIAQGDPTEYKLTFEDNTLGFEDVDWTEASSESKIAIVIPDNCPAGTYTASVSFRDETGEETDPISFSFRVNLPPNLTVAIFEDVVSIDNRGNRFSSYQWFHNGEKIEGATKPYYQERGGLTGSYYVKLNIGTAEETRTCPRSEWEAFILTKKEIIVSPNPMVEEVTIRLNSFEGERHTLTLINEVGTTILMESFEGESYSLNCGGYASGKYIINVDGVTTQAIKK